MIRIPSVINKTIQRPNRPQLEEPYLIPDLAQYSDFWSQVYSRLRKASFGSPCSHDIDSVINDEYGYYGFRVHPVTKELRYFHAGISLDLDFGTEIRPIFPGVLEYSGYGAVNGHYVLLSHPEIQTEDGYVLHTMYCHLKKPLLKFNSYQKMLREISLSSYPIISVSLEQVLGTASVSGLSRASSPGIYLQISLRKFDQTPIVLNPMLLYADEEYKNTTAEIHNKDIICEPFLDNKK